MRQGPEDPGLTAARMEDRESKRKGTGSRAEKEKETLKTKRGGE